MTIGEIIQRVQNLYSKGTPSDDSRLSERHIYNKLLTVRSRLITQEMNRRRKISRWNYQTIPCVELIEVPQHECPCIPEIGCKILRSKHKIPKPLVSYSTHFISSVTSIDGSVRYTETTFEAKKYKKGNKYTKGNPDYYIKNGYIYITFRHGPRIIAVTGLFEDPSEVAKFPTYCSEDSQEVSSDCGSILDGEFPVEADMLDAIVELSINELVNMFSKLPEDLSNNSADSIAQNSK